MWLFKQEHGWLVLYHIVEVVSRWGLGHLQQGDNLKGEWSGFGVFPLLPGKVYYEMGVCVTLSPNDVNRFVAA